MRAWQVTRAGEPEDALSQRDVELPAPQAGRLRVRVEAAALGLPDVLMCRGSYPLTPSLPFTPGQEVAGTVEAVGEGCAVLVGSHVMGVTEFVEGYGGLAAETTMAAANCYPVPAGMQAAHAAAFFIPYHTAWVALVRRGQVRPGQRVVVLGAAGGTGAAAVQVAKALGAEVVAVAGGEAKTRYCAALGADVVVDARTPSLAEHLVDLLGARSVDAVFDPVGGQASADCLGCLGSEGSLLMVGFASGATPNFKMGDVLLHNASAVGVYVGAYDRAQHDLDHDALLDLVSGGHLSPADLVTETVGFDAVPAALSALARREALGRKVMTLA